MKLKPLILLVPLLFYVQVWLTFVFNIDVIPGWLFYDTDPHPEDPPPQGLLPDGVYFVFMFLFLPLSFLIGSIYTAYKKLWWWFAVYMILAGFPLSLFMFG